MEQNQPQDIFASEKRSLPNATTVLVLGILSIVLCFICGIVALIISATDRRLYQENPQLYTSSSYDLIKAGRICSIIGLCIVAIVLLIWMAVAIFAISFASFN